MIAALHTLVYSDDPVATRAFFRDVLQLPYVRDDVPEGQPEWLIFRTGPSELGVHPTTTPGYSGERHHEIALVCDDIGATMADLEGRGATFSSGPTDMGFGLAAMVQVPGADDILIYEARHVTAYDA